MAFSIRNHLLFSGNAQVPFKATTNQGGALRPAYLIMHYTAGTSLSGATSWFSNPAASASAHLTIDYNGKIVQSVAFNKVAWHAGASSWAGISGMNRHSIGIELVNAGKLKRKENGKWENWSGAAIPPARVIVATHKHESSQAGWEAYPQAQLDAAMEVAVALHASYHFLDVLGHDDISPNRKVDPGPAFPMLSFSSKVLGRE